MASLEDIWKTNMSEVMTLNEKVESKLVRCCTQTNLREFKGTKAQG